MSGIRRGGDFNGGALSADRLPRVCAAMEDTGVTVL
jgi:hypothetical protein